MSIKTINAMPYKEKDIEKKYWSIGEIAKELNTTTSAIRFWCKELDIKIGRSANNTRQFNSDQRSGMRLVHYLIKKKGFTIEGVKHELSEVKIKLQLLEEIMSDISGIASDPGSWINSDTERSNMADKLAELSGIPNEMLIMSKLRLPE